MARVTPTPTYMRIAETLETEIGQGQPEVGERLPSEADLAVRFSVNRHTMRQALGVLQAKGVVQRVKGHGAYVAPGRLVYRIGRDMSFSNSVARLGMRNAQRVVCIERAEASEAVAAALQLVSRAPVIRLRRIRYAGRVPLAVLEKFYPEERFPGIEQRLRDGFLSTRELLRRHYGSDVLRARSSVEIEPADQQLAAELGVQTAAPLLRMESLDVLTDRTPVEWGTTWFRGDATRIEIEVLPEHSSRVA